MGGGAVAGGGARGAGGMGGGVAVTYERQATSKKRLNINWQHPVPVGEEQLDLQSVIKELRGNDARPLLILRDCENCKGRDDAILSRSINNDEVYLASHWFHCVKLDRRVIEPSHPWHALFADKNPPHLIVTTWDGEHVDPFDGRQTQRTLMISLHRVLKKEYKKSAEQALSSWLRILSKFDAIDDRLEELRRQADEAELEDGRGSRKALKLRSDIEEKERELELAKAAEKKLMNLILRRQPEQKTEADFDAEAAQMVKPTGGSSLLDKIRKKGGDTPDGSGQEQGGSN